MVPQQEGHVSKDSQELLQLHCWVHSDQLPVWFCKEWCRLCLRPPGLPCYLSRASTCRVSSRELSNLSSIHCLFSDTIQLRESELQDNQTWLSNSLGYSRSILPLLWEISTEPGLNQQKQLLQSSTKYRTKKCRHFYNQQTTNKLSDFLMVFRIMGHEVTKITFMYKSKAAQSTMRCMWSDDDEYLQIYSVQTCATLYLLNM